MPARQHNNVAEPSKGRAIGYDATKANQRAALVTRNGADRIGRRARDDVTRNAGRPIGFAQHGVNRINVRFGRLFDRDGSHCPLAR